MKVYHDLCAEIILALIEQKPLNHVLLKAATAGFEVSFAQIPKVAFMSSHILEVKITKRNDGGWYKCRVDMLEIIPPR